MSVYPPKYWMCILSIVARQRLCKIIVRIILYAVRVLSNESEQLVLPSTSWRSDPLARESYRFSKLLTVFTFVIQNNTSNINPKTIF
jgi:hypothetical protein